jgi:hypothetical protein
MIIYPTTKIIMFFLVLALVSC